MLQIEFDVTCSYSTGSENPVLSMVWYQFIASIEILALIIIKLAESCCDLSNNGHTKLIFLDFVAATQGYC